MRAPENFERIIDRKRYSTETATLIADDVYWDGQNYERSGRNMFLYLTPKGNYFTVTRTQRQGEQDSIMPLSLNDAIYLYESSLSDHHVDYEDAFPSVTVEDA